MHIDWKLQWIFCINFQTIFHPYKSVSIMDWIIWHEKERWSNKKLVEVPSKSKAWFISWRCTDHQISYWSTMGFSQLLASYWAFSCPRLVQNFFCQKYNFCSKIKWQYNKVHLYTRPRKNWFTRSPRNGL